MSSDVRISTGAFSFEAGVDSSKVPLIQSAANPNGLPRNALAWLSNGTVRGGAIAPRFGFQPLCKVSPATAGKYQGGFLYDQSEVNGGNPYLMLSIEGRMIQVRVDTDNSVNDVTGAFTDPGSAAAPQAYFEQGEQFLLKQAGDGKTLPLIWDGHTLRRSLGIIGPNNTPTGGVTPYNELPAATSMKYYQGQFWYAQNRTYCAGDVVFDTGSGTGSYNFSDSVLKVTENPVAFGGDGFAVPASAGNIRAFGIPIALDQTLGQGPLFIFTTKQIYSLTVPSTRADWIAATANNQPTQVVVMNNNGTVSERSVVPVNGDLFFQTLVPSIMSYFMSLRYFQTWGNSPISNNINRALQFNNRALMHVASGIQFNNRLYQTILPVVTPVGIAFQAIASLDMDPISTLQNQNPPAWDGILEDLDVLQLFEGDFGGLQRAFAVVHSRVDDSIEVWELTQADRADNAANSPLSTGDKRIQYYFETPAFDWSEYPPSKGGGPFALKELDGLDLWLDQVSGDVLIKVEFRPDEDACYYPWFTTKICSARNSCEDVKNPVCYPVQPNQDGYRNPISAPKPTNTDCGVGNKRPVTWGYKFQLRITITGWARVRGYHIHATQREQSPFYNQIQC